jgi:hypothetical protein
MKKEIKKIGVLLILLGLALFAFVSGEYELLTPPLQLVAMKVLLVTAGFLLGHIAVVTFLPKVDFSDDKNWQLSLFALGFYLVIPSCFAIGG